MDKTAVQQLMAGVDPTSDTEVQRILDTIGDPHTLLIRDYGVSFAQISQLSPFVATRLLIREVRSVTEPEVLIGETYARLTRYGVSHTRLQLLAAEMLNEFVAEIDAEGTTSFDNDFDPEIIMIAMQAAATLYGDLQVIRDVLNGGVDELRSSYSHSTLTQWCTLLKLYEPVDPAQAIADYLEAI